MKSCPPPLLLRRALCLALLILLGCSPLINRPGSAITSPELRAAHFVAADGAVLPVRRWLPHAAEPKAVVIALHGFNDYSQAFEPLGDYLATHGIGCYAYDQRGFGLAPGRGLWAGIDAYARDLDAVVAEVRTRHPGAPAYLLGESMGGAVAIFAMTAESPPPAEGLILSAPAVWSRETMPWYQRYLLALSSHTVPWLRLTGEGLGVMASDNIEMLRGLGRDPNVIKATRVDAIHGLADLMDAAQERVTTLRVPTLVLYGERDEIIPRTPVQTLLDKLPPGTRFAYYRQGYHLLLRDLQADQVWRDIAGWVTAPTTPLPSGAERQAAERLSNPGGA